MLFGNRNYNGFGQSHYGLAASQLGSMNFKEEQIPFWNPPQSECCASHPGILLTWHDPSGGHFRGDKKPSCASLFLMARLKVPWSATRKCRIGQQEPGLRPFARFHMLGKLGSTPILAGINWSLLRIELHGMKPLSKLMCGSFTITCLCFSMSGCKPRRKEASEQRWLTCMSCILMNVPWLL